MKIYKFLAPLAIALTLGGCSNNNSNLEPVQSKSYSLTSPKGINIASDENELLLKLGLTLQKNSNEFIIDEIEYFEGDDYSFAAVSAYVNSDFNSVLLINEIPDNKIILQDGHSIKIVNKGDFDSNSNEVLHFTQKKGGNTLEPGTGAARCFGGDSCKWETVIDGREYNCGCPAPAMSMVITTSGDCKVES